MTPKHYESDDFLSLFHDLLLKCNKNTANQLNFCKCFLLDCVSGKADLIVEWLTRLNNANELQ